VHERHIMPEELEGFEQCWLTGTAAEVTPVGQIGDYNFEVGALTREIAEAYEDAGAGLSIARSLALSWAFTGAWSPPVNGAITGFRCLSDVAVFSVFRRTAEHPMYRIEKRPKLREWQGQYAVIGMDGRILKRGHDLKIVLRVLERKLIRGRIASTAFRNPAPRVIGPSPACLRSLRRRLSSGS
jgi:hypothetical protein